MNKKIILYAGLALGLLGGGLWLCSEAPVPVHGDTRNSRAPASEPSLAAMAALPEDHSTPPVVTAPETRRRAARQVARSQPENEKTVTAPSKVPAGPFVRVEVKNQRVHLQARQTSLSTLLRDLAAKTGITVTDHANTRATAMNIAMEDMTLDEALKNLLAAYDVFFLYRGADSSLDRLKAVWIYPKGQGIRTPPHLDEQTAVLSALTHADPAERAQAYEAILQQPDLLSPEILLDGLQDEDAQVRLRVLAHSRIAAVVVPADTVERLALTDAHPQVRLAALALIGFHPDLDPQDAERIALAASNDPEPEVQSQAMELLQHLEATHAGTLDAAFQTFENEVYAIDPSQLGVPVEPN